MTQIFLHEGCCLGAQQGQVGLGRATQTFWGRPADEEGTSLWAPKVVGGQTGRNLGDVLDVGIVHLLDLGVWNVVGLHHVLKNETRLQDRLLRDALHREAGRQV